MCRRRWKICSIVIVAGLLGTAGVEGREFNTVVNIGAALPDFKNLTAARPARHLDHPDTWMRTPFSAYRGRSQ